MKNIVKNLVNDSIWSISGLVIMNLIAQFFLYPFWDRYFGSEKYGTILYLISLMNVVSITLGSACTYTRITNSSSQKTSNTAYIVLLAFSSIVVFLFGIGICFINHKSLSGLDAVFYVLLCILSLWRNYADVEYRLHINYKGYFCYYLTIGIGYIIGVFLMRSTGIWTLGLLPGEVLGLLFVMIKGNIFRIDEKISISLIKEPLRLFLVLSCSYFIDHLVYNGDRILLNHTSGGLAVSTYYIASLFGKTMSLITTPFNSVVSGYLAKHKGNLSIKMMNIFSILAVIGSIIATIICTIGSYIILPLLYPDLFPVAKNGVLICSFSQCIYFITNIISVIILRFSKSKYQVYMNLIYAFVFIFICIPASKFYGQFGFYVGLLITSLSRFFYGIGIGYYSAIKQPES